MIAAHLEPKGLARHAAPVLDAYKTAERRSDAERGSSLLLRALLGQRKTETRSGPAPEPPKFRARKARRGRPRKSYKVRRINTKIVRISEIIAQHFGLTVEMLMSREREWKIARPRQIAMYAARKTTTASLCDIGFHFGGLDHTTVIHAVREIERRIEERDSDTVQALLVVHAGVGS